MRRVLLVAYYFPPEPVAGALRPGYAATYLPEFGWEATVLTRTRNGNGSAELPANVVAVPVMGESFERSLRNVAAGASADRPNGSSPARKVLRWAKRSLSFPDGAVGWLPSAVARGTALARERRFDAVLSTATPATAHLIGSLIGARAGIPWIADYRDPWAGNPGAQEGRLRAAFQMALERAVVRRAADVTTISEPIAAHLERIHRRPVSLIPNATDTRDWEGLDSVAPDDFQLTYTGCMYAEHRSPALLFEAMASLRARREPAGNARVLFLGPTNDHLMEEARRYGVDDLVAYGGVVPRSEALTAQRAASDLLIFLNMDPSSAFELGSKIIEYTHARRPILAFGPQQSVMREHIRRHNLGWFASTREEAEHAVSEAYRRFHAGDIELPAAHSNGFDARSLARAFAERLDEAVKT